MKVVDHLKRSRSVLLQIYMGKMVDGETFFPGRKISAASTFFPFHCLTKQYEQGRQLLFYFSNYLPAPQIHVQDISPQPHQFCFMILHIWVYTTRQYVANKEDNSRCLLSE